LVEAEVWIGSVIDGLLLG